MQRGEMWKVLYWPFKKSNDHLTSLFNLYINARTNHSPMIKKQLSELSCNSDEFQKAATPYNITMQTSSRGLAYANHATDNDYLRGKQNHNCIAV